MDNDVWMIGNDDDDGARRMAADVATNVRDLAPFELIPQQGDEESACVARIRLVQKVSPIKVLKEANSQRAVTLVLDVMTLRAHGREWQHFFSSIMRLNRCRLVCAEHRSIGPWVPTKANYICGNGRKTGFIEKHVTYEAVPLQVAARPDGLRVREGNLQPGRLSAVAPARCAVARTARQRVVLFSGLQLHQVTSWRTSQTRAIERRQPFSRDARIQRRNESRRPLGSFMIIDPANLRYYRRALSPQVFQCLTHCDRQIHSSHAFRVGCDFNVSMD